MTTTAQIEANRRNAMQSTGPRSDNGKAIACRNSLKHGLTANPAAGAVEDGGAFDALLDDLAERIAPQNPIDAGLVHTIAISLWRQQRAANVDAAMSNLAVERVMPVARQEVQQWIGRINDAWKPKYTLLPAHEVDRLGLRDKCHRSGNSYVAWLRTGLSALDDIRENELMASAAGLTAMIYMLKDLNRKLEEGALPLSEFEEEQLAWLMGETAGTFSEALPGENDRLHKKSDCSMIVELIGQAIDRRTGEPVPDALRSAIEGRVATLRQQRDACEDHFDRQVWTHRHAASLLPDAAMLDRLVRYETHADRRLVRALETLARLRGAAVETIMARVCSHADSGAAYQIEGRREQWHGLTG